MGLCLRVLVTLIPAHGQIFLALVLEAMELYHRDQIDALERVLGDSTYKFVEVDKASVVVVVAAGVAVVLKKKLVKSLQAIAYSPRFPRFPQK